MRENGARENLAASVLAARDGWTCAICRWPITVTNHNLVDTPRRGVMWSPLFPHRDHIVPISQGGLDAAANLQLTHQACNLHKHDTDFYGVAEARSYLIDRLHLWALEEELGKRAVLALRSENRGRGPSRLRSILRRSAQRS